MKKNALVIAGALAVFSTAFPKSVEAESYEFWYAYQAGALAMLCSLHKNGVVSTNAVKESNEIFTSPDPDIPKAATTAAINAVLGYKDFKNCPLTSP